MAERRGAGKKSSRRSAAKKKVVRRKAASSVRSGRSRVTVEDESDVAFRSIEPLSYFGTDFDVHGLVRRLDDGEILIPSFDPPPGSGVDVAGFQRGFVWKKPQMDRFIESLLLGFPVPGIFLVQQSDRKLLVLDGQQRLRTLQKFYAGKFQLENVTDELEGLMYETLDDEARRTLDNTFIHATVVKYDPEGLGDDSVYQLFERLNTGGTNLYPQEIRVALYSGKMVDFIRDLNSDANWRALFGPKNPRLKDQELVLRFLALYLEQEKYERPLRAFLNHFIKNHRYMEGLNEEALRDTFSTACKALNRGIGKPAFRLKTAINAALVDSVMIGMARRAEKGGSIRPARVRAAYDRLVSNEDFLTAIARATADEERVRKRLELATNEFARI